MENCIYSKVCELAETDACTTSCIRYIEMHYLLSSSNIPLYMQRAIDLYPDKIDYDNFVKLRDYKDDIVKHAENGDNLYLYSPHTGNGKTSWAIKIMLKYFDSIWAGNGMRTRGIFINVPNFLTRIKNFNIIDTETEILKRFIPKVDLVIWDDISSTKPSDYDNSQLLTYIDSRILCGKSNIFTSNVNGQQLINILGNRLTSRTWNNSTVIELLGKDRRGVEND